MRHDDMIRTAVALAAKDSSDARAAAFRQLVDLSLQARDCDDTRLKWRALRALERLQKSVPVALRNAMIDKAARHGARSLHLRLFRSSVTHHYDRLMQVASLDEAEWWRLARRAPPHLHAGMLARRDLPGPVRELLKTPMARGGAGRLFVPDARLADRRAAIIDKARFAPPLPADAPNTAMSPAIAAGRSQVSELIERITAFRARTQAGHDGSAHTAVGVTGDIAPRWTWRCDEDGVLVESPDMPAALLRHWLTEFETPDNPGKILRSFDRRLPFRDLTVTAPPRFAVQGRWRLSGLPQFDRKSGRFTGYWGSAIALDQAAAPAQKPAATGLFGTGASSEALTTMAHEVRTPLNAIIGFAQLIEGEILGVAGSAYRQQAGNILKHAEHLLGAFDDLSDAARIEQGRYPVGQDSFDPGQRASEIVSRYESLAIERDVALVPLIAADLSPMTADSSVFDRALSRLMTATLAAAAAGETIYVIVQRGVGDNLRIAVSRPHSTSGKSADALLDPSGFAVNDNSTPILGVGFALKLVGSLAGTIGGSFELGKHLFELRLPFAIEQRNSEAS